MEEWCVVYGEETGQWAVVGPYKSHEAAWEAACEDARPDGRVVHLVPHGTETSSPITE